MTAAPKPGKRLRPDGDGRDPDRQVDQEQPWPRPHTEDDRGQGRARRGRYRQDQRIIADAPPEHARRIGRANQRRIHAHDRGRANTLEHAGGDQRRQAVRERATDRPQGEQRKPRNINAPIPKPVAERGQRQHEHRDRQLIGIDDPHRCRGGRAEVLRDRRQRDICDRSVEDGHRQRQPDRNGRPIAARRGQTVRVRIGQRLSSCRCVSDYAAPR